MTVTMRMFRTVDDATEDCVWYVMPDDETTVERLRTLQARYHSLATAAGVTKIANVPTEPREMRFEDSREYAALSRGLRTPEKLAQQMLKRLDSYERRAGL